MYASLCLSEFLQQAGPRYGFQLLTVQVKVRDFFHGSHWSFNFPNCRRHFLKVPIIPPIHTELALIKTLLERHLIIIVEELIEVQVLDALISQDRIPDDPLRYGQLVGQHLNLSVQAFLYLFLDLQLPVCVDPILIVLPLEFPHQIVLIVLFLFVYMMDLLDIIVMLLYEATHLSLGFDQFLGKLLMPNDPGLIYIIHMVDGIFKDLDLLFISEFLRLKKGIRFGLGVQGN